MERKHHISEVSYQMLFDYLDSFLKIEYPDFRPHLKKTLIGYWCKNKEEELHSEGDVCKKAWFITKGMIYLYFIDQKKGMVVFMLFQHGEIAIIPDSFMNRQPSSCFIMACVDTEVLEISKSQLNQMRIAIPQILELEHKILANYPERGREREALLCLESTERIIAFFEIYTELHPYHQTVKMLDKHIANYLQISQFRYSRLKKALYP